MSQKVGSMVRRFMVKRPLSPFPPRLAISLRIFTAPIPSTMRRGITANTIVLGSTGSSSWPFCWKNGFLFGVVWFLRQENKKKIAKTTNQPTPRLVFRPKIFHPRLQSKFTVVDMAGRVALHNARHNRDLDA